MLILGSTSPRRKEILSFFKIPFHVIPPDYDESLLPYENNPLAYVKALSQGKASAVLKHHHGFPVLTADTIVTHENRLFLKPTSRQDAFEMLRFLSGKTHRVLTAVTLSDDTRMESQVTTSHVTFQNFTDAMILNYIDSISIMDKAGSYAIQGIGSLIVKKIEGCFYNVMGLPLIATQELLTLFGFSIWDYLKNTH